jgi:hypothetical protein
MPVPPKMLSSVFSRLSSATSSTVAPSDLTAYFSSMAVPATRQLKLQERTISSLTNLRYDNATSRASTAVALRDIQAELGRLVPTLTLRRGPGGLAEIGAAQATAIQQLSVAIGELADGLTAEPNARVARLERARALTLQSEAESRQSAELASAVTNRVAAAAGAVIPVVGPIIAAILASIAAILILIGTLVGKSKEEDAAAQKGGASAAAAGRARHGTGTEARGIRWPP